MWKLIKTVYVFAFSQIMLQYSTHKSLNEKGRGEEEILLQHSFRQTQSDSRLYKGKETLVAKVHRQKGIGKYGGEGSMLYEASACELSQFLWAAYCLYHGRTMTAPLL